MSASDRPVRPPCLKCGSRNVAWIQWGKPIWRDDLIKKLDRKEVVLGSCFMTEKGEVWECNECHHRFGSHSFKSLMAREKGNTVPLYIEAQEAAWLNIEKIQESRRCGCYHCLKVFTRWDLNEWITDVFNKPVPLCPYCQQDSIIGDAQGYPITRELLVQIRNYCYDTNEWWEDNEGRVLR